MPDGDRITHRVRFEWRQPYEGLMAKAEPGVVGPLLAKSVAAALRRAGGVPILPGAVRLVSAVRDGELSQQEAFAQARRLGGSSASGLAAARALGRCLIEPPSDIDPRHAIATVILDEYVKTSLLGKSEALLVKDQAMTRDQAAAYIEACRAAALQDLARLASQVVAQPFGGRYRAPAHRRPRKATSELLQESIE